MSDMTHDGQPTANQPQQPNLESRINTRRAQLIKALANLKRSGALGKIQQTWLAKATGAPVLK